MPRPMIRRAFVDPEELDVFPVLVERDDPAALRALVLLFPRPVELPLLLEPRAPLLALPFPPLAPRPPLLRFGMSILL